MSSSSLILNMIDDVDVKVILPHHHQAHSNSVATGRSLEKIKTPPSDRQPADREPDLTVPQTTMPLMKMPSSPISPTELGIPAKKYIIYLEPDNSSSFYKSILSFFEVSKQRFGINEAHMVSFKYCLISVSSSLFNDRIL
jgi:hypothetical protein